MKINLKNSETIVACIWIVSAFTWAIVSEVWELSKAMKKAEKFKI